MLTSNVTGDVEPEWQPAFPACDVTGDANANILNGSTADETICGLDGNDPIDGAMSTPRRRTARGPSTTSRPSISRA